MGVALTCRRRANNPIPPSNDAKPELATVRAFAVRFIGAYAGKQLALIGHINYGP